MPMEFWIWPYIEGLGEDVVVLFFKRDNLSYWRLWTKYEGQTVLYNTWGVANQGGMCACSLRLRRGATIRRT